MNKRMRLKVIKSIKDCYKFLENEFEYKIIDEESSSDMFFYVRYENNILQRIISVAIDVRDRKFNITFWKSVDGSTSDENMLDFKEYLVREGISESVQGLTDSAEWDVINGVNKYNSKILKKYGLGLIRGEVDIKLA